jgi:hypothetical protein
MRIANWREAAWNRDDGKEQPGRFLSFLRNGATEEEHILINDTKHETVQFAWDTALCFEFSTHILQ